MAHKTRIGGTAYEVSGGKTLVGGTAYSIAGGRTLVGGTGYGISFEEAITLNISHTGSSSSYCVVKVNGTSVTSSTTMEVKNGDVISMTVYPANVYGTEIPGSIRLNGTEVSTYSYSYTVNFDGGGTINIACTAEWYNYWQYGWIEITTTES